MLIKVVRDTWAMEGGEDEGMNGSGDSLCSERARRCASSSAGKPRLCTVSQWETAMESGASLLFLKSCTSQPWSRSPRALSAQLIHADGSIPGAQVRVTPPAGGCASRGETEHRFACKSGDHRRSRSPTVEFLGCLGPQLWDELCALVSGLLREAWLRVYEEFVWGSHPPLRRSAHSAGAVNVMRGSRTLFTWRRRWVSFKVSRTPASARPGLATAASELHLMASH